MEATARPSRARAALAFALAGPLAACVIWPAGKGPGSGPVAAVDALAMQSRGEAVIVDVRGEQEFASGHIPGAVRIPGSEIEARAAEIRRMGRLPILYCG